ncbi:unnamed protein product [Allacma fusca]|uniref:Uncharacterized protein n=1 Tax=Allacma fusca TaxID=39272 RepID=A0A8J2L4Z5_9HEXA|nr:unnamed protein product [Allacma fusca]
MTTYQCTICLELKEGNHKRLHKDTPVWNYHVANRQVSQPELADNGVMCPPCDSRARKWLKKRDEPPIQPVIPVAGAGEVDYNIKKHLPTYRKGKPTKAFKQIDLV